MGPCTFDLSSFHKDFADVLQVIKVTNAHEASTRREVSGSGAATEITDIVEGVSKSGEPMLVPARWFLIIKEGKNECYCLYALPPL